MQEIAALLLGCIVLVYVTISTLVMEQFRRRASQAKGIVRGDLRRTIRRIVILTLLAWTILSALLLGFSLVADEPWSTSLTSGVSFCLFGFLIYAAFLIVGYFTLLWWVFRLPLVDNNRIDKVSKITEYDLGNANRDYPPEQGA
jgi:hypothetical protein